MQRHFWLIAAAACLLTGCNDQTTQEAVPEAESSAPVISPTDFVLLPCKGAADTETCTILAAGGKRVLFGTPSSAMAGMNGEELLAFDGVLLFSLKASETEGLDTFRNKSWRAGRRSPALIYGPPGTDKLVSGLNMAFEAIDAIEFLEDPPKGGFNSALLSARSASGSRDPAFDTGDLKISSLSQADGSLVYEISYGEQTIRLSKCEMVNPVDTQNSQLRGCKSAWAASPLYLNKDN